ncbi:Uncharacterized protein LOK49_LG01G03785 [Camellia lanceoleosa]|uniref:Uncharacterized protein n=1 Tax=Camellia lanceoleosa TaxID=1840588 RepID=A0ACC0J0Z9_9ERIC|nr:Uncharacterized protein LOK49_LG01G03785 [Camellia lanceoleosa]
MEEIVAPSEAIQANQEVEMLPTPSEVPQKKSFKQALTATKQNEKAFDSDLDRLFTDDEFLTDEEDNEALSEDEQAQDLAPIIPRIKLHPRLVKLIRKPWKDCLIVRLLGKTVGFKFLVNKLKKIWGLQGDFEATNLGLGFFLVKFEMLVDCNRVYTEGPWIIMDHYLTVHRWEYDFKPSEAKEVATTLWVRFPQLPIEYYNEKVLYHIAKVIGKPLKVDLNTAMSTRGRYARVCVEVDLTKPLVSRFAIGKYLYIIEYEHLHYFCFACGKIGHRKEYCSLKPIPLPSPVHQGGVNTSSTAVPPEHLPTANTPGPKVVHPPGDEAQFGPWMIVSRRTCKPTPTNRNSGPIMHKKPNNRFSPLTTKPSREETSVLTKGKEIQVPQALNPHQASSSVNSLHSNSEVATHPNQSTTSALHHTIASSDLLL